MKINEFIKKANNSNEIVAKRGDSSIGVYDNESNLLFRISLDATNFLEIDWSVMCADDSLSREFSKRLSALIEELLHTPVKDRFSKKKYRLMAMRYVEGPIAIKQYVTELQAGSDYMGFRFGIKESAGKWTDKELSNLSTHFPKEVIDAMKEPVEDN